MKGNEAVLSKTEILAIKGAYKSQAARDETAELAAGSTPKRAE